ncbi:MAG: pyrroline-5-carboxylate reductase [Phycisphaerales bacterium]|nr:pyrroline-5-carboxylate reductase [Phycisphaerales bacterium]
MATISQPLLVIGGGNMGRAIVQGAVRAGTLAGGAVVVLEPDGAKHAAFLELGCAAHAQADPAVREFKTLEAEHADGLVLLSVKPQMLGVVAETVGSSLREPARLVMSVLAGATTTRLAEGFGARVVRLMPNTPAQIGLGITAMCAGPGATGTDLGVTRTLFASVGRVIDLDEDLLDAFTAVAGSGPAYVYLLAEGMAAGAEAVGFTRPQAAELARATIIGAAGLLQGQPEVDPAALRAMVTSKGGTTAAALQVLDEGGVVGSIVGAIVAARDRGRELGRE